MGEMLANKRKLVLLRYHRDDVPLYFVIEWEHEEKYCGDDHISYVLEVHSCPTNWIDKAAAIIDDGDSDPHGFLEFVRAVDEPEDHDEDWREIFPEAFTKSPQVSSSAIDAAILAERQRCADVAWRYAGTNQVAASVAEEILKPAI